MISRAQQIFDLYEQKIPTDEIARRFETEVFEVHRIVYRIRQRMKKAALAQ